jgi:polyisoprenoid-binding protein YceI
MTIATDSRTFDGIPIPTAGTFNLDPAHTHVGFAVRHLMVAQVKGHFGSVTGTVVIGREPLASSLHVTVDAASITTGDEQRDDHLRSPDFFAVTAHPTITFDSTAIRPAEAACFEVDGLLTIKGISRPVTLTTTLQGVGCDPWGNERAGFSARAEIDRDDWGLTWNQVLETGGVLVGQRVVLELEAEIVRS